MTDYKGVPCKHCGKEMDMMVNISVVMPSSWESNLTKKRMQKKEFEIWGADWGTASLICGPCHHTISRRRLG